MTFRYYVELQTGYLPTMETLPEHEISFTIEAKNRATADRMIRKLIKPGNVTDYDGIALE